MMAHRIAIVIPPAALCLISGNVSSITGAFYFGLTAGEEANGTSNFTVVPEPATMALLGLGGLLFARKKK